MSEHSDKQTVTTKVECDGITVRVGFSFETQEGLVDWLKATQGADFLTGWLLRDNDVRKEIARVLAGGSAGWSTGFPDWNEKLRIETLDAAGRKTFAAIVDQLASAVEKADKYYEAYFRLYHWIHDKSREGAFRDDYGHLAGMPLAETFGVFSPEAKEAESRARAYIETELIPAMMAALNLERAAK